MLQENEKHEIESVDSNEQIDDVAGNEKSLGITEMPESAQQEVDPKEYEVDAAEVGGSQVGEPTTKELKETAKRNKKQREAQEIIRRYKHSKRPLYKSIIKVLSKFVNKDGEVDESAVDLVLKAGELFKSLAETSRWFFISVHWAFTVCNPKILNPDTGTDQLPAVKYSPVYEKNKCDLPNDNFGELAREELGINQNGETILEPHSAKLVGDQRFVDKDAAEYGSAWNSDGDVIKTTSTGTPVLDKWMGLLAQLITEIQDYCRKQCTKYRSFEAFLLGATRDVTTDELNAKAIYKPAHAHIAMQLPRDRSRYQMMHALSVNFDDFVKAFDWISNLKDDDPTVPDRIAAFLAGLEGVIRNFEIPESYESTLKYLVHQSLKAKKDVKAVYKVAEVTAWLPDEPLTTYAERARVSDDGVPADGLNAEVMLNLQSPYNLYHHTATFVSEKGITTPLTFRLCRELRAVGTRGADDALIRFIREGKIAINDVNRLVHAAFDDKKADFLLSNEKRNKRFTQLLQDEIAAICADPEYSRDTMTIIITSSEGGLGKTFLAKLLARHFDKGREPHFAATKDKGKTFDPYQDYENEFSSVLDEVSASWFSWESLKRLLDAKNVPDVPSRYKNRRPWAVHHMFLTQVYPDGVSRYVRQVLRYAAGVSDLGYLEKDKDGEWRVMETPDARAAYNSNLSQLLRRLPVWIEMKPSDNGRATNINIHILAYKPTGRSPHAYDYCHTESSMIRINTILDDDTPAKTVAAIAKKVAKTIDDIQAQAKTIFQEDPLAFLPDADSTFIADKCDFWGFLEENQIASAKGKPNCKSKFGTNAKPDRNADTAASEDNAVKSRATEPQQSAQDYIDQKWLFSSKTAKNRFPLHVSEKLTAADYIQMQIAAKELALGHRVNVDDPLMVERDWLLKGGHIRASGEIERGTLPDDE